MNVAPFAAAERAIRQRVRRRNHVEIFVWRAGATSRRRARISFATSRCGGGACFANRSVCALASTCPKAAPTFFQLHGDFGDIAFARRRRPSPPYWFHLYDFWSSATSSPGFFDVDNCRFGDRFRQLRHIIGICGINFYSRSSALFSRSLLRSVCGSTKDLDDKGSVCPLH
jgi:hypothetical protein